jgi:ribonucleotide reductase beta subunit family protein with ferritin-like domain
LAELNEKISYDESMHRDYGCARYRELPESEKPPLEHVIAMIQEFVDLEIAFANELSKGLEEEGYDFTPTVAKKFIHFMANSLLLGLGYESHWEDAEYPDYMRGISNSQKSNFYEVNVAAYSQFSLDKIFKDSNETDQIEFDVDKVDF